jgi:hypothetical protein
VKDNDQQIYRSNLELGLGLRVKNTTFNFGVWVYPETSTNFLQITCILGRANNG